MMGITGIGRWRNQARATCRIGVPYEIRGRYFGRIAPAGLGLRQCAHDEATAVAGMPARRGDVFFVVS
jgi:hypothetical protein